MGEKVSGTYKREIVWINVFLMVLYHIIGINGLYYFLTFQLNWKTVVWTIFVLFLSGQGITTGVHRLWSHRSYKANFPLQVFLCFCQTIALQNDVIDWARDHRVHHKFTDTDADPYNSTRGFFFCHMGWLLVKKHPDVKTKGKTIDISDLESNPILAFQRKYYWILAPLAAFIFPTAVPIYFWGENWYKTLSFVGIFRYLYSLHCTWLVNSAAHMWGMKPYNKNIKPAENKWVSRFTLGEGWHNYHHTFPWDYKAAELHIYGGNVTTGVIDLMAKIGWAYDLKTASDKLVQGSIVKNNKPAPIL